MVHQKRFIVVFTSKDGEIFNRAVVYDDDFLNSALIGRSTPPLNAGASFIRATNLMKEINNLKGGYTSTLRQYEAFESIPDKLNIGA
jgi:hypothetical protein